MGNTRFIEQSEFKQAITHSAPYRAASSRAFAALTALALSSTSVAAQATDTGYQPSRCVRDTTIALPLAASVTTQDSVAPGIGYRCVYSKDGPWAIHVVSIDLKSRRYALEGARAMEAMFGREKLTDMVQRFRARGDTPVVAINADFFSLRTGEVENNAVIGGNWVKGVRIADSPHDGFDNAHTQFGVDDRGRPLIGRFTLRGEVRSGARREKLIGINYRPPAESGLVLYTPWFGSRTPHDSAAKPAADDRAPSEAAAREDRMRTESLAATRQAVELALVRVRGSGSDAWYRAPRGGLTSGGGAPIPENGAVLSGTGRAAEFVRRAARSGLVHVTARLGEHAYPPRTVVGGWPRLIEDGRNVAALADSVEGTFPRFSAERHPRSAIGISRDSTALMLVVVDGRRPWSVGMSLVELADQLLSLGAFQAMNLDGGGSSTLWVHGTIVNYPSDAAGERPIGNAVIVVPAK